MFTHIRHLFWAVTNETCTNTIKIFFVANDAITKTLTLSLSYAMRKEILNAISQRKYIEYAKCRERENEC